MTTSLHDGVAGVGPGKTYIDKQDFTCGASASAETLGAQKVCMNVLPMPPGAVAKVYYHEGIETIAYLLGDESVVHCGDELQKSLQVQKGEQALSRLTSPMRHSTIVLSLVPGLLFIHPAVIRTASFFWESWIQI